MSVLPEQHPENGLPLKEVDRILVFDIDGVLTDPHTEQVNKELLGLLAHDLRHGIPVLLNTGRSVEWALDKTLPLFRELGIIDDDLDNLIVAAEKGGVVTEFKDGQPSVTVTEGFELPLSFANNIKQLLGTSVKSEPDKFLGDSTRFYPGKKTMITLDTREGHKLEDYQKAREGLQPLAERMLREAGLSDTHKVDQTVTGFDIEHVSAGKHLGAQRISEWLKRKHITTKHVISCGDSPSDFAMAQYFAEAGIGDSTFVFVDPEELREKVAKMQSGALATGAVVDIVYTDKNYDQGTIDYVGKLSPLGNG